MKGQVEAEEGARVGMPSKLTHQTSFSSYLKGGIHVHGGEQEAKRADFVGTPPPLCRRHKTVETGASLSPTTIIFLAQFLALSRLSINIHS